MKVVSFLFVKLMLGLKSKLQVFGLDNIPKTKASLLLGNHVSWIDWAIVSLSLKRKCTFVIYKQNYDKWYEKLMLSFFDTIEISNTNKNDYINKVAKKLDNGNLVVMFPEVNISKNGHLGELQRDFELILKQTNNEVLVNPFYIKGLWETKFSKANKKYKSLNKSSLISISFDTSMNKNEANKINVKKAIKNLSISSWIDYINKLETIPELVFNRLKKQKFKLVFADSTGMELSAYKFMTASILFKNLLKPRLKNQNIGIILPSTCAGAFINLSVMMLGKTAVNLNFTANIDSLLFSIKDANIKSIITSKNFINKLLEKGIDLSKLFENIDVIYLEDIKTNISKIAGLKTLLSTIFLPTFILKKTHINKSKISDTALIMFSSGSEGTPKGIELTHRNVVGNCKQISSIINVNENDKIVGSLPFFHAFGTVVTLFYPLIEGIKCVCHPDPTDGYSIGKLIEKYKATIMLGTSTFLRLYVKNPKMTKEMLESIRLVVAGAEKLSSKVRTEFKTKFDLDIYEGYGVTETTPVASCNLPNIQNNDGSIQIGNKIGTVGMAIPGTKFKIVDPNTNEELNTNEEGMVLIGGVQVMKGYLNNEAKSANVLLDIHGSKWYITGDKGKLDEDGFLTILDRYSRFAKLGGEMISLTLVEEKIKDLVKNELTDLVTTAINDDKKGEKIVCLISNITHKELEVLKKDIISNFDSKLMIPSIYKIVEEIPKLGSGKSDFAKAKKIALETI